MMKLITKLVCKILIFLGLLISLLTFFLYSTPGLVTLINIAQFTTPGSIKMNTLNGRFLDGFTIGKIEYQYHQFQIEINNLVVHWRFHLFNNNQLLIDRISADTVEIKQADSLHTVKKIWLTGVITPQRIDVHSLHLNYLDENIYSQIQIDPKSPYVVSTQIQLNPVVKNNKQLSGTFDLSGDLKAMHYVGDFHGLANIKINGTLNHLDQLNLVAKWHDVVWSDPSNGLFESPEGSLRLYGTLPNISLELDSQMVRKLQERWQIKAAIHGKLPWQWRIDMHLERPWLASLNHTGLYTSISAKGVIKDQNDAKMALTVHPGRYYLQDSDYISVLEFQGGTVQTLLTPQNLSGHGSVSIDPTIKLALNFRLPKFDPLNIVFTQQKFLIELSLIINSFDFLTKISPELKNPKGQLIALLKSKGTLDNPIVESQFNLKKASVDLPKLGLHLNNIDLTVMGKEKKWNAFGTITSANKTLTLKGEGAIKEDPTGELSVQGSDFPIMDTPEYKIRVSPQLKVSMLSSILHTKGSIVIPYAQINPQNFSNSISLPEDVFFKTNKKPDSHFLTTSIDVNVKMGEQVKVDIKRLKADLSGLVYIKQVPNGPITATGELFATNGKYTAYGQNLDIERARLIYTGGRWDNPNISLRASKSMSTTKQYASPTQSFNQNDNASFSGKMSVGVDVTGQLSQPKIHLFSNPAVLSQSDILSMLVLGYPASQANKAGGQLLLAALSSMRNNGGINNEKYIEQLKQALGIDLDLKTDSNYNFQTNQVSDTQGVVIGKSVTKRIYVSYNVGLSQADPNVMVLKYLINKFLSMQISNSDTSNAVDIIYTAPTNTKGNI